MSIDRELADILRKMSNDARITAASQIPGFIKTRNIRSLFHFTSLNNLESILTKGFMGRESLNQKGVDFTLSDFMRNEPILDGVCFSLSRPNHYMAARKIAAGHDLVLLEIGQVEVLLAQFNFIASPGNFGSTDLKNLLQEWPEKLIGGQGLMNLFNSTKIREQYSIPDFEPTDPQAEIIFLDNLPKSCIKKVYFPNSTTYSVAEELRKITRRLPTGILLQSKVEDVFPAINWHSPSVVAEYRARSWNETWIS